MARARIWLRSRQRRPEIYFHRNSVADDAFDRLAIGARVAYSEEDGADGPPASRLTLLGS